MHGDFLENVPEFGMELLDASRICSAYLRPKAELAVMLLRGDQV
jgi:hypothetical protein